MPANRQLTNLLYLLLLLLLWSLAPAGAQTLRFEHFSETDGLNNNYVRCFMQDSRGFIWIGTWGGLNRYDGYQFKDYPANPGDKSSLQSGNVEILMEMQLEGHHYIWVGTQRGIRLMDPASEKFYLLKNDPLQNKTNALSHVYHFETDSAGYLWVAVLDYGLIWMDPTTIQIDSGLVEINTRSYFPDPKNPASLSHKRVYDIFKKSDGSMWVTTIGGGLNRIHQSVEMDSVWFQVYRRQDGQPGSLPSNTLYALDEDGFGRLWVSSNKGAFYLEDADRGIFKLLQPVDPADTETLNRFNNTLVIDFAEDERRQLWMSSINGLYQYDLNSGRMYSHEHQPGDRSSLPFNTLNSLFIDRQKNLWVATHGQGFARNTFSNQPYRLITHVKSDPSTLSHPSVSVVLEKPDKKFWIGTFGGGLNLLDSNGVAIRKYLPQSGISNSLADQHVTALFIDSKSRLWVGTGNGLSLLNRGERDFTNFYARPSDSTRLTYNYIQSICEDDSGTIWLATLYGGLNRIVEKPSAGGNPSEISFRFVPLIKDNFAEGHQQLTAMHKSEAGYFWISSSSDLYRFDPVDYSTERVFPAEKDRETLAPMVIQVIFQADENEIWLSTSLGLFQYFVNSGEWRLFTASDGLQGLVKAILPGDENEIWVSTRGGIARIDRNSGSIEAYDVDLGFRDNGFHFGAGTRIESGELFFGGIRGLVSFFPSRLRPEAVAAPLVLTDFQVFESSRSEAGLYDESGAIQLSYRENHFSFQFALLNYNRPKLSQYRYYLEGFDRDWVFAGNRRYASYTNVPPGEYNFRVRAANKNRIWSDTEINIPIVIQPPYWDTWWFRILAALAVAALGLAIYRYRVNQLLKIERTRTRIARDLHDEVSANLSSIHFFSDAISREDDEALSPTARNFLSLIDASAGEAREAMDDIIWAINPQHDDWQQFLARLRRYASDLFNSKGIGYHFQFPDTEISRRLDMENQRDIWLIFKEIITNIVKHADCRRVHVQISQQKSILQMIISDDGRGFDTGAATQRNGLANIRARAANMNAECHLSSEPGQGTRWQIRIKL